MEQIFSQKLKHLRRENDLTQDDLAMILGVSPQSVSRWERAEGFPDITLLPEIANYFGITIDALLGNDKQSMSQEYKNYQKKVTGTTHKERIPLAIEFYRTHPRSMNIVYSLAMDLGKLAPDEMKNYQTLLRELCEKLVKSENRKYRESAVRLMCLSCPDDEFEKWHNMCADSYEFSKHEIFEERMVWQNSNEESMSYHDVNDMRLLLHFIRRLPRCVDDAEKFLKWSMFRVKLIESFREDGEISPMWYGGYAKFLMYTSAALFGCGKKEEGYLYLEKALRYFKMWLRIPYHTVFKEEYEWLSDPIEINMPRLRFRLKNGTEEYCDDLFFIRPWKEFMYGYMTNNEDLWLCCKYEQMMGWRYFDSVRDEERYKIILEEARKLAETEYGCGCEVCARVKTIVKI